MAIYCQSTGKDLSNNCSLILANPILRTSSEFFINVLVVNPRFLVGLNSLSFDAIVQGSSQGLYCALKPCFASHVDKLPESSRYFLSSPKYNLLKFLTIVSGIAPKSVPISLAVFIYPGSPSFHSLVK